MRTRVADDFYRSLIDNSWVMELDSLLDQPKPRKIAMGGPKRLRYISSSLEIAIGASNRLR